MIWYVVVTDIDQNDFKVSAALDKAALTPFLPFINTSKRDWRGRNKSTSEPVYPGYLFCNTQGAPFEAMLKVKGVKEVLMMCGTDKPAVIEQAAIDEIRALCNERGRIAGRGKQDVEILKGMVGRIIEGPWRSIPWTARKDARNGNVEVDLATGGTPLRAVVPVEILGGS